MAGARATTFGNRALDEQVDDLLRRLVALESAQGVSSSVASVVPGDTIVQPGVITLREEDGTPALEVDTISLDQSVGFNVTDSAGRGLVSLGFLALPTYVQVPTVYGGESSGGDLILSSTSHATKDRIFFGSLSAFDEVNNRIGLGLVSPSAPVDVYAVAGGGGNREPFFRARVADAGNSAAAFGNLTSSASQLEAGVWGYYDNGAASRPAITLLGMLPSGMDSGTDAIIRLKVARTSSATDPINGTLSAITTRSVHTGFVDSANVYVASVGIDGSLGLGLQNSASGFLNMLVPAAASNREKIMFATVSDDNDSGFGIANGTTSNSVFAPHFWGQSAGNPTHPGLTFIGFTTAADDTGTVAVIRFKSARSAATGANAITTNPWAAVATRPLYDWTDYNNDIYMQIGATGQCDFYRRVSATSSIQTALTLNALSSGIPAAGFGTGINFYAESSTTEGVQQGQIAVGWDVATHASRKSQMLFYVYDATGSRLFLHGKANAGGSTDCVINGNTEDAFGFTVQGYHGAIIVAGASTPDHITIQHVDGKIGFFGATPIVRNATPFTITNAPAVSYALDCDGNGGANYTAIADTGATNLAAAADLNDLRADVVSLAANFRQLVKYFGDTAGLGAVNETSY